MDKIVYAGFAGVGKTMVSKYYPDTFIDLDSSDYKWIYSKELAKKEKEYRKGFHKNGKELNPLYPQNYIFDIKRYLDKGFSVMISCQSFTEQDMGLLKEKVSGIRIILVYPDKELKPLFLKRFLSRGNTDVFVKKMERDWEKDIDLCTHNKMADEHIVIKNSKTYLLGVVERHIEGV